MIRFIAARVAVLLVAASCLVVQGCKKEEQGSCIGGSTCGSSCVDTRSDLQHCGACGHACGGGERCVEGSCVADCGVGQTRCGAVCVSLQSDVNHCGMCEHPCSGTQVCSQGRCSDSCADGLTPCDRSCVNVSSDPRHCSSCSTICTSDKVCSSGQCGCPLGQNECSGQCFDLKTERLHCGDCATSCSSTQVCSAGSCADRCSSDLSNCGGICTDVTKDAANCGACGKTCAGGKVCSNSKCACPDGQIECNGQCFDPKNTIDHCGDCSTVCANGLFCVAGKCSCPKDRTECDGVCIDTATDNAHCGNCTTACTAPKSCVSSACTCPTGQNACGDGCVDLATDNQNCGTCGNACTTGRTCSNRQCACTGGTTDCSGACVDLQSNVSNCGACGKRCEGTNAVCSGGSCLTACPLNTTNCSGSCVDLKSDLMNCGACGTKCTAGQACSNGSCTAIPAPKIARSWPTPTGWKTPTSTIEMTFEAVSIPGAKYTCRTGPRNEVATLPFTPCDGGTGALPSHRPTEPTKGVLFGSFRTEARIEVTSTGGVTVIGPSTTYDFYVNPSLDGVAQCAARATDNAYFDAAKPYFMMFARSGALPTFPTSVQLSNPQLNIVFTGVNHQIGEINSCPACPVSGTVNWKGQSLRKRFTLSSGRDMLLVTPRYASRANAGTTDECKVHFYFGYKLAKGQLKIPMSFGGWTRDDKRQQQLFCDAMVFDAAGHGVCVNSPSGTPAVKMRDSAAWKNLYQRTAFSPKRNCVWTGTPLCTSISKPFVPIAP